MADETKTNIGVRSGAESNTLNSPFADDPGELAALAEKIVALAIMDKETLEKLTAKSAAGAHSAIGEMEDLGLLTPFQAGFVRSGEIDKLRLDEYLLLDKIGEGGMGEVFRAKNLSLDRVEAIKVIRGGDTSPIAARRFQQEAKALARLEHPGIVPVYRIGRHQDADFIAMKFVEGETLKEKMVRAEETHTEFSIGQSCRWMIEAAEALGHAHRQGIIHRDVKPGNLMVANEGRVVVLDLGIAQLRDPTRGGSMGGGLTQQSRGMGTPEFMPPEQWADARGVTPESDIYSLACTFFWVLTGRPAYSGDQIVDLLRAHSTADVPLASSIRPAVPKGLDAIFKRAMAKHPKDRFASMTDLVEALMPFAYEKQVVRTGSSASFKLTDSLNKATELIGDPNVQPKPPGEPNAWNRTATEKKTLPVGATATMIVGCIAALWFAMRLFGPDDASSKSTEHPKLPALESSKENPHPKATDIAKVGEMPEGATSAESKAPIAKPLITTPTATSPKAAEPTKPAVESTKPAAIEPFAMVRREALSDEWSRSALSSIKAVLGANEFPANAADKLRIGFVDVAGEPIKSASLGQPIFAQVESAVEGYWCFVRFDGRDLFILPIDEPLQAGVSIKLKTRFSFSTPGKKRFIVYQSNVPLVAEPVLPDHASDPTFPKLFENPSAVAVLIEALESGSKLRGTTPAAGLRYCNRMVIDMEVRP